MVPYYSPHRSIIIVVEGPRRLSRKNEWFSRQPPVNTGYTHFNTKTLVSLCTLTFIQHPWESGFGPTEYSLGPSKIPEPGLLRKNSAGASDPHARFKTSMGRVRVELIRVVALTTGGPAMGNNLGSGKTPRASTTVWLYNTNIHSLVVSR